MVAVLIGMALVYRFFPKQDEEETLRASYEAADERSRPGATAPPATPGEQSVG